MLTPASRFGGNKLEGFRQPLEDRAVAPAHAAGTLSFPANFTLTAGMNSCPRGYSGALAASAPVPQGPSVATRNGNQRGAKLKDCSNDG